MPPRFLGVCIRKVETNQVCQCLSVQFADMSTDISIQTTTFGGSGQPSHYLPGPRPHDLPISAGVWDVAKNYGKDSAAVVAALYEAVKKLEAEQLGVQI